MSFLKIIANLEVRNKNGAHAFLLTPCPLSAEPTLKVNLRLTENFYHAIGGMGTMGGGHMPPGS